MLTELVPVVVEPVESGVPEHVVFALYFFQEKATVGPEVLTRTLPSVKLVVATPDVAPVATT
jgi:hypothetical protein